MNGILSVVYMNKSMKLEKLVLMKQIGNWVDVHVAIIWKIISVVI
jgi:hypothetical protein